MSLRRDRGGRVHRDDGDRRSGHPTLSGLAHVSPPALARLAAAASVPMSIHPSEKLLFITRSPWGLSRGGECPARVPRLPHRPSVSSPSNNLLKNCRCEIRRYHSATVLQIALRLNTMLVVHSHRQVAALKVAEPPSPVGTSVSFENAAAMVLGRLQEAFSALLASARVRRPSARTSRRRSGSIRNCRGKRTRIVSNT